MRFMYWPNESDTTDPLSLQVGPRKTFSKLQNVGRITELSIYSYRAQRERHSTQDSFDAEALAFVRENRPDVLFVSHPGGSTIGPTLWKSLRREFPELTIVYHEGDDYGRFIKPIDRPMQALLEVADLVMIPGLGGLRNRFAAKTSGQVRFLPTFFDSDRFITSDPREAEKRDDVVLIGNRTNVLGMPFLFLPSGRKRARLVSSLSRHFGPRFALYGSGWGDAASARGRLDYRAQEAAIQAGRISVGWSNFDRTPYCFSDRVPISLAAGVPHVTSWQPGLEQIFEGCPGIYFCKTVEESLDCCAYLLSRSDDSLLAEGLGGRQWVKSNLEAEVIFTRAFEMVQEALESRSREP